MDSTITFERSDVQNMLDVAQVETGVLYGDIPYLRDSLQTLFREGLEQCNVQGIDLTELLSRMMWCERTVLDAFNKHRLGNAATRFNQHVVEPDDLVEYNEAENIPERLAFFPLRAIVAKHGIDVVAAPIYQGLVAVPRSALDVPTINNGMTTAVTNPNTVGNRGTGSASASYNKLQGAPSPFLPLPAGNLTFAEITAFVPQSIKSVDVINRIIRNGAYSTTIADMINYYREMEHGPIPNNSVYRMLKVPMEQHAKIDPQYKDWTVAKHSTLAMPAGFNSASVSVAGFSTPVNNNAREAALAANQPPPSILFRDLAKGVKVMPSGDDALDLTRCVQYSVQHPNQNLRYPQHFARLVALLGGPTPVRPAHLDAAAVSRRTSIQKLVKARQASTRQRDDHGRLLKQKSKSPAHSDDEEDTQNVSNGATPDIGSENPTGNSMKREHAAVPADSDEDALSSKRSKVSAQKAPARQECAGHPTKPASSRLRKEIQPEEIDSESDGDAYAGPKRQKKTVAPVRSLRRTKHFSGSYNVDKALQIDEEDEEPFPTPVQRISTPP
ncbi:hypothetical protein BDW02DRAFT_617487 [Decorospora gaudefroyi]|uniref:Uncharacterized protein n=1 Tax=Decorospora gaudefroyi TaxID=184978 RepID=A0A6A5KJ75_9PLEO|nr:hypothetical protein BDW02DRAFT_617487 [Decorospora gaudefroyi]